MTPSPLRRRTLLATGLAGALGLGASACGAADGPDATAGSQGPVDGFPLELANCAEQLRFETPPQRVVLLESSPVTLLDGIGVLDRVVARAGSFPRATSPPSSRPASTPSRRCPRISTPRAICRSIRRW
ncbi:hypothetical protein [Brachybacterium sp. Z12]|uniref:hypothetical protein n=1 Tax=Brachybacterium sp. Z12 TaxID=2759167 RepID=UPI00223B179A|nr:hypothetical protein [Brachybacterium sp. Z12]